MNTAINHKSKIAFLFSFLIGWAMFFFACKDIGNPVDIKPCPLFLTIPTPPYNSPVWHPSGEFIGFNHIPLRRIEYPYGEHCQGDQYFQGDSTGFWLINPDGTNIRRIFPFTLQSPAWSPDGEWIAFCAPQGSDVNIFKMRFTGTTFDTTTLVQLTFAGRNFFPAWSPDGIWIAYDSNQDSPNGMNFIWKMRSDGSEKLRIAYTPNQGEIRVPNWSPNGKTIAHLRYVGVGEPEIFVMDTSGGTPLRLTSDNEFDSHPRYSPDGTRIAFWSGGDIRLMDSLGANRKQLTTDRVDGSFGLPFSWSADGSSIVYARYDFKNYGYSNGVLWVVEVSTKVMRQLTFN